MVQDGSRIPACSGQNGPNRRSLLSVGKKRRRESSGAQNLAVETRQATSEAQKFLDEADQRARERSLFLDRVQRLVDRAARPRAGNPERQQRLSSLVETRRKGKTVSLTTTKRPVVSAVPAGSGSPVAGAGLGYRIRVPFRRSLKSVWGKYDVHETRTHAPPINDPAVVPKNLATEKEAFAYAFQYRLSLDPAFVPALACVSFCLHFVCFTFHI